MAAPTNHSSEGNNTWENVPNIYNKSTNLRNNYNLEGIASYGYNKPNLQKNKNEIIINMRSNETKIKDLQDKFYEELESNVDHLIKPNKTTRTLKETIDKLYKYLQELDKIELGAGLKTINNIPLETLNFVITLRHISILDFLLYNGLDLDKINSKEMADMFIKRFTPLYRRGPLITMYRRLYNNNLRNKLSNNKKTSHKAGIKRERNNVVKNTNNTNNITHKRLSKKQRSKYNNTKNKKNNMYSKPGNYIFSEYL